MVNNKQTVELTLLSVYDRQNVNSNKPLVHYLCYKNIFGMPRIAVKGGTWKPYGDDALYIYKNCEKYPDFGSFIRNHKDWDSKYERRNLRQNFNNCKRRLKEFKEGTCKFN